MFNYLSDLLKLEVSMLGLDCVLIDGLVVLVFNYLIGIVDGVVLFDVIKEC